MIKRLSYVALFSMIASSLLLPLQIPKANAPLALTLDGVGTTIPTRCCYRSPQSQLLTTTRGHDVILVIVEPGYGAAVSVSDTSGLNFVQRLSFVSGPSSICQVCRATVLEYYAVANAPLTSDNITVAASRCCSAIFGVQTLAISVANTRAVFDTDPSIPASVSCSSTTCGTCYANGFGKCSASIDTSTFDVAIATTAINDAGGCGVYNGKPPPGFTKIANPNSHFEVDYLITQTPRTAVTFDCYGTDAEAIVLDAISFYGAFGIP
jgi:hypothetical protein